MLMPLFDSYASGCEEGRNIDPRLSPIFRSAQDLPHELLLIIPAIDILLHEQLSFVERLKQEAKASADEHGGRIETMVFEKGFHGWLQGKCWEDYSYLVQEGCTADSP